MGQSENPDSGVNFPISTIFENSKDFSYLPRESTLISSLQNIQPLLSCKRNNNQVPLDILSSSRINIISLISKDGTYLANNIYDPPPPHFEPLPHFEPRPFYRTSISEPSSLPHFRFTIEPKKNEKDRRKYIK